MALSIGEMVTRALSLRGHYDNHHDAPGPSTFLCPSAAVLKIKDPPFGLSYYNDGVPCYVSGERGGDAFKVDARKKFSYCFAYTRGDDGVRIYGGGDKGAVFELLSSFASEGAAEAGPLPRAASPSLCATAFCNCPFSDACVPELSRDDLDESMCIHSANTRNRGEKNSSANNNNGNGAGERNRLRGPAVS
jgi:hypothetical protein